VSTKKSDVIASATRFRDALHGLANDGNYSESEKNGFSTLHLFYADRVASFQIRPRFGDESEFYQNPLFWADEGTTVVAKSRPNDRDSQIPVYNAANSGGDSLEAVTELAGGMSRNVQKSVAMGMASVVGSLLTTRRLS
jgi:hypothetical protein